MSDTGGWIIVGHVPRKPVPSPAPNGVPDELLARKMASQYMRDLQTTGYTIDISDAMRDALKDSLADTIRDSLPNVLLGN